MQTLLSQYLTLLPTLWWPFCRIMAALSLAPFLGEQNLPVRSRILLAMLLAVTCLPTMERPPAIDLLSFTAVILTVEQVIIGLLFGVTFQLSMAVLSLLGFLLSSQMGLSMAEMNDPGNTASSSVVANLLYLLGGLVFFAMDGHLLLVQLLASSFRAWPVGGSLASLQETLFAVIRSIGWVMSTAMLLALPGILSTFIVQIGVGMINRVAPALNLYSLSFPIVTLFGLSTLLSVMPFLPDHIIRMHHWLIHMIDQSVRSAHVG